MPLTLPVSEPDANEVVVAVDVGSENVKTAVVGPGIVRVHHVPTTTDGEPWSVERLERIVRDVWDAAVGEGRRPAAVVVAVPGQVDEYHGAVQYSPTLPWHDVAVADRVAAAVGAADGAAGDPGGGPEVLVRHAARVGALAESNLGAAAGEGTVLYVSVGASIVAAGASSGTVVPDHVGAGELGGLRLRSGVHTGKRLDVVASAGAVAAAYAARVDAGPDELGAVDVQRRLATDADARAVWNQAVDALADGLEMATLLYRPQTLVIGGGLTNAGDDLLVPLVDGVTRRLAPTDPPRLLGATFGDASGWVGAALAGWQRLRWPVERLRAVLDDVATVLPRSEDAVP